MTTQAIASYVAALTRELPGPTRLRSELLRELTDGLEDATAAHVRAGLSPDQAAARAVAECGRVDEVAAAYRTELTAAQSRRTALLLALGMPGLVLLWDVPWWVGGPWDTPYPPLVHVLADVTTHVGLLVGVVALAVVVLSGVGARFRSPAILRPRVARLASGVSWVGAVGLLVTAFCSVGMAFLNPGQTAVLFATSWLGVVVESVTVVAVSSMVRSIWRTHRTAHYPARARAAQVSPR